MARSDVSACGTHYYCYPLANLDSRDERDILAFSPIDPRGSGLVAYLRELALPEELSGMMRTYLVRDNDSDELAGYFSLKAGLVTVNEMLGAARIEFDTVPGVELANFAMNGRYRDAHPDTLGNGGAIFSELVIPIVRRAAGIVGIALLYLFSLPEEQVIANYERYGFSRLGANEERALHTRLKPRYDDQCVFMYAML